MLRARTSSILLAVISLAFAALPSVAPLFGADKESVLHNFGKGHDGNAPEGGLIFDAAGNLYGTTLQGGAFDCAYDTGCGTVFELTPQGDGTWQESILHYFDFSYKDGFNPNAALIFDSQGNLYGTTTGENSDNSEGGSVFELSPQKGGRWKFKLLYAFGSDGGEPWGGSLIFDPAGNLYGTTSVGGDAGNGTVFELTPRSNGQWKEKVLHSFKGTDGEFPNGGLVFDTAGNLYGTTCCGGDFPPTCGGYGCGTVFELTPEANGSWKEHVLHRFNGTDGFGPGGSVTIDAGGNLYGTTEGGGNHDYGIVFELSPGRNGKWKETILHRFNGSDGSSPSSNLIFDAAGNLYGTTLFGGLNICTPHGCGTAFELMPSTGGKWTEKVLVKFQGMKGQFPSAPLIFDNAGNLYGETDEGGPLSGTACFEGCGVVFQIIP
jgi:uncharacterized repeat protein (TIGR03803 family)